MLGCLSFSARKTSANTRLRGSGRESRHQPCDNVSFVFAETVNPIFSLLKTVIAQIGWWFAAIAHWRSAAREDCGYPAEKYERRNGFARAWILPVIHRHFFDGYLRNAYQFSDHIAGPDVLCRHIPSRDELSLAYLRKKKRRRHFAGFSQRGCCFCIQVPRWLLRKSYCHLLAARRFVVDDTRLEFRRSFDSIAAVGSSSIGCRAVDVILAQHKYRRRFISIW